MRRVSLCLFALMALPATAHASEDEQLWTTTSATVKLSDHWRLQQEIVARFSNDRDGLYEIESNTLVGYKLDKQVTLVGFGDIKNDPQRAALLSKLRAMAVRRELVKNGVVLRDIRGFGAQMPVAANTADEGRIKNRRVEVWVY